MIRFGLTLEATAFQRTAARATIISGFMALTKPYAAATAMMSFTITVILMTPAARSEARTWAKTL